MKTSSVLLLLFVMCTLTGCVSVELGGSKSTKASGVKLSSPSTPFQKSTGDNVDAIWRNPKNGNAISYLSDCGDSSDPSLMTIEQGVLSGLYPYTYQTQSDMMYQGRAARRIQVKGQVDGLGSLVDMLIFKRNSCIYILTFVGLAQDHAVDLPRFNEFTERFHAP